MISLAVALFSFVAGVSLGSFIGSLVWRLGTERVFWWKGRSICPKCQAGLSWADNIPLLSYLFLKGRCRHCRAKISPHYFVVELLTGILFVLIWLVMPWGTVMVKVCLSLAILSLVLIFITDLLYGIIPDEALIVLAVSAIAWRFPTPQYLLYGLIAAVFVAIIFVVLNLATHNRAMGWGDIKMFLVMGPFLGWQRFLVALWIAFVLGGIFGVGLIFGRRKKLGQTLPLGPFLAIGTVASYLLGDYLLALYWRTSFGG